MSRIRVLIVDDHAMFREGICSLLSAYDDVEVVGEAGDGREGLEKVSQLAPDVVLVDIAMPVLGGFELTRRIRKDYPNSKVLVLTQYDSREYVLPLLKAGASGYITKREASTELLSAIRAVHNGNSFLCHPVAKTLIDAYLQQGQGVEERDEYVRLTDREREILKLIAEGHSNREIARRLVLSIKTVVHHRASIMEKLGIHNLTELIKYAIRKRMIDVGVDVET